MLEDAAAHGGIRLPVLVEIDVGAGRCGVSPGPEAVALAQRIAESRHLSFGGLQAYHGSAQHKRTVEERRKMIDFAVDGSRRTVEQLRQQGLECPIVGGAGTGTFVFESASGVYNEIQAGSYVFMDADYARNLDEAGKPVSTFRHSLFVLATVMSTVRHTVAVLDAGHKAVSIESGMPTLWARPDIKYVSASDEHGKLEVPSETSALKLGEKVRLVPGHCDPTVDRYDWYVGVRNGRVECLWPVAARGAMYRRVAERVASRVIARSAQRDEAISPEPSHAASPSASSARSSPWLSMAGLSQPLYRKHSTPRTQRTAEKHGEAWPFAENPPRRSGIALVLSFHRSMRYESRSPSG